MVRVFLTRPLDDSKTLAHALTGLGYDTAIEPLLAIQPMPTAPPDLRNIQAVMITSAHALDFLDPGFAAPLLALPCFCVGANTAEAARSFGFTKLHSGTENGAGLAQQMIAARPPCPVLHIAGRDSDGAGRDALLQKGFVVKIWVTYAAEAATQFSAASIDLWRTGQIDAALLFSSRTADTLKTLLKKHGLELHCKSVIALGISEAVRSILDGLPWRRLESADRPLDAALLQLLQKHLPVSEVSHD